MACRRMNRLFRSLANHEFENGGSLVDEEFEGKAGVFFVFYGLVHIIAMILEYRFCCYLSFLPLAFKYP
jgi:hypothetical protein